MNPQLRSRIVVVGIGLVAMCFSSAWAVRAEDRKVLPKLNAGKPTRVVEQDGFKFEIDLSPQVIEAAAEEEGFTRFGDEPFSQGDTIEIVADAAPLQSKKTVLTRLQKGRRFQVLETSPGWLRTQVVDGDKVHLGWVSVDHAKRIDVDSQTLSATAVGELGGETVSVGVLIQKAKQFDDGLYAAVEFAAQNGAGDFTGKKVLLSKLIAALSKGSPTKSATIVVAAAELGGQKASLPRPFQAAVQSEISSFNADPFRSKPLGFYTWNKELSAIFRQDRMLQTELKPADGLDAVVAVLRNDADAGRIYASYLGLVDKLTNPSDYADLRAVMSGNTEPANDAAYRIVPPSTSHEAALIKKLYGNRPIPDGFDLMQETIDRIRAGSIDLKPTDRSGWYDYQVYSLETLVLPDKAAEAKKVLYNDEYRNILTELFKGAFALARETHVKQLESPAAGAAAPVVPPRKQVYLELELSVEPTATHYHRRAEAYRFVQAALRETFGDAALKSMHRLTAAGPVAVNLDDELQQMTALFEGAALVAARQLGLAEVGKPLVDAPAAEAAAAKFLG